MTKKPAIGIGVDSFVKLITGGFYYVDKTELIAELVPHSSEVTLFTRPRRFGKSLAMSMLAEFFDITKKEENAHLFDGLKISEYPEICREYQNAYPVLSLSFKDVYGDNAEETLSALRKLIAKIYIAAENILLPDLKNQAQRDCYLSIESKNCDISDLEDSLLFLTELLHRHYGLPVILLLDEYDVPLQKAFVKGFYEKVLTPVQKMISAAFKGNHHLKFGVITGCLRAAKDSIFTGMNNLQVNTILTEGRSEHFGFTPAETEQLLTDCGLADKIDTVRKWYDGYLFGDNEIYNPWSVLSFAEQGMKKPQSVAKAYWMDTSSNDIFLHLVDRFDQDNEIRREIEGLIGGIPIKKTITESTTFKGLESSPNSIWSTLLFTGYLKPALSDTAGQDAKSREIDLVLPNKEVREILVQKIDEWFDKKKRDYSSSEPAQSFFNGDLQTAQREINSFLRKSVSVRDENEAFYHGVLTALLKPIADEHQVISNRESGDGYPDITMISDSENTALVIEVKKRSVPKHKPGEDLGSYLRRQTELLNDALDEGEKQIRSRHYAQAFLQNGYDSCLCYAAAFVGKECRIRKIVIS